MDGKGRRANSTHFDVAHESHQAIKDYFRSKRVAMAVSLLHLSILFIGGLRFSYVVFAIFLKIDNWIFSLEQPVRCIANSFGMLSLNFTLQLFAPLSFILPATF